MSNLVQKRSEIVFCYDIKDANPNGDPLDSNKPRIDEETGINLVTDVRLKRTVRDYLYSYKGFNGGNDKDIFVREVRKADGKLKTKEDRMIDLDIKNPNDLLKMIDIRLFGATTAVKEKTITFTGPIQFNFGRSMHKINLNFTKGTTVMPSKDDKKQGTFTEYYTLPYSFISFYGIVNENAAKETGLTEADVKLLLEGMWEGTKNLISRSKFGQLPRVLIKVNYTQPGFFIGELNKRIKLVSEKNDEEIRDVTDFYLDITELKKVLEQYSEKIESLDFLADDRLVLKVQEQGKLSDIKLDNLLPGKTKPIQFNN